MASITVSRLKELMLDDPGVVIVDVRTKGEIAEGQIPNAVWMDMSDREFMVKVAALPKDATYCFYCASGGRTSMLAPLLKMNGFSSAYDLDGGIGAWIASGGETV